VKSPGEGQGSTFILTLPLSLLEAEEAPRVRVHPTQGSGDQHGPLPDLAGIHVLVVDDEADARELVRRLLEEHGAKVTVAASGEDALRAISARRPDVLVSDIGMPTMDGFQMMRHIRAGEDRGNRMPALALTAFARAEDRKRALLAGYQAHLAKPFDISELVIILAGLIGRT